MQQNTRNYYTIDYIVLSQSTRDTQQTEVNLPRTGRASHRRAWAGESEIMEKCRIPRRESKCLAGAAAKESLTNIRRAESLFRSKLRFITFFGQK